MKRSTSNAKAAAHVDWRKVACLLKISDEVIPSSVVMATRREPSIMNHFCIFPRIDTQVVKERSELGRKYSRSRFRYSEIPTVGAIASIGPAAFRSPICQQSCIPVYALLPVAERWHAITMSERLARRVTKFGDNVPSHYDAFDLAGSPRFVVAPFPIPSPRKPLLLIAKSL